MPFCCGQDYDELFDGKTAEKEASRYREKGVRGATARLLGLLRDAIDEPVSSLLDIGGGVGVLQHELGREGHCDVLAVDASRAYLKAATREADRLGYADRHQTHEGDFVDVADRIEPADVVTLDKVICCYPNCVELVRASSSKAQRLYAIVVPRERWWIRAFTAIGNLALRVLNRKFRAFVHPIPTIDDTVREQGLRLSARADGWFWAVRVYVRV